MKRKAGRGRRSRPGPQDQGPGVACGRRASAGTSRRTGVAPLGASNNNMQLSMHHVWSPKGSQGDWNIQVHNAQIHAPTQYISITVSHNVRLVGNRKFFFITLPYQRITYTSANNTGLLDLHQEKHKYEKPANKHIPCTMMLIDELCALFQKRDLDVIHITNKQ